MRKVIGIGETILDIIFRNGQPTAAVPGGSVFNGIVSLARRTCELHQRNGKRPGGQHNSAIHAG